MFTFGVVVLLLPMVRSPPGLPTTLRAFSLAERVPMMATGTRALRGGVERREATEVTEGRCASPAEVGSVDFGLVTASLDVSHAPAVVVDNVLFAVLSLLLLLVLLFTSVVGDFTLKSDGGAARRRAVVRTGGGRAVGSDAAAAAGAMEPPAAAPPTATFSGAPAEVAAAALTPTPTPEASAAAAVAAAVAEAAVGSAGLAEGPLGGEERERTVALPLLLTLAGGCWGWGGDAAAAPALPVALFVVHVAAIVVFIVGFIDAAVGWWGVAAAVAEVGVGVSASGGGRTPRRFVVPGIGGEAKEECEGVPVLPARPPRPSTFVKLPALPVPPAV